LLEITIISIQIATTTAIKFCNSRRTRHHYYRANKTCSCSQKGNYERINKSTMNDIIHIKNERKGKRKREREYELIHELKLLYILCIF